MGFSLSTPIKTSTLNAWLKAIEDPIYRANPLMAMMKKRGLINYRPGEIGTNVSWPVRYLRDHIRELDGVVTERSFTGTTGKLHAQIEWTGYDIARKIGWLEKKINSNSSTQIYNLVKTTLQEMMDDFLEDLGIAMWQDGTVTGTGMQGVLSMHGGSSTATADGFYNGAGTYTAIVPVDGVSSWWACAVAKTYAGLLTTLGNKVNSWSGADTIAWPAGSMAPGHCYWHPIQGDYNSRYFTPSGGSSTHSWDTQWQQSFNAVSTYQQKLHKVPVDTWILDADLMRRAKDSLIDNSRFIVSDSSEMRTLGFKDLEYNGWSILTGYGVPDGCGFGFTWDKMELRLLQNQLVEKTDDHDIATSEDLHLLQSGHQMLFKSPTYFPALVPASAAGT